MHIILYKAFGQNSKKTAIPKEKTTATTNLRQTSPNSLCSFSVSLRSRNIRTERFLNSCYLLIVTKNQRNKKKQMLKKMEKNTKKLKKIIPFAVAGVLAVTFLGPLNPYKKSIDRMIKKEIVRIEQEQEKYERINPKKATIFYYSGKPIYVSIGSGKNERIYEIRSKQAKSLLGLVDESLRYAYNNNKLAAIEEQLAGTHNIRTDRKYYGIGKRVGLVPPELYNNKALESKTINLEQIF